MGWGSWCSGNDNVQGTNFHLCPVEFFNSSCLHIYFQWKWFKLLYIFSKATFIYNLCGIQVWMCLSQNFSEAECPSPPDLACYVFNEAIRAFIYYGPNSYLRLVSWANLLVSGAREWSASRPARSFYGLKNGKISNTVWFGIIPLSLEDLEEVKDLKFLNAKDSEFVPEYALVPSD